MAGLIDDAHPALADQFEDFQFGEMGRQLGGRGRAKRLRRGTAAAGRRPGLGTAAALQTRLEHAVRAEPLGGVPRHFGSALRTWMGFRHGMLPRGMGPRNRST